MAMTADSAQGHHTHNQTQSASSVAVSGGADGVNNPSKKKSLPWAQVVMGEADAVSHAASPSSPPLTAPEKSDNAPPLPVVEAAAEGKKPKPKPATWKSPTLSNGADDSVMGAISWPALSESTKPSPKSAASLPASSDSSPKPIPDVSEVVHTTPHSRSGPGKSNSGQNRMVPARQRSMKKGGGGNNFNGGSSAGGHLQNNFSNPPSPPPYPVFHMHPNMVHAIPDHSPRAPPVWRNNWEPRGGFVPQPPAVNDHKHSSRMGNFGPRGEGSHQNNLGGKDRALYGGARDNNMQRGSPRGYVQPPPPNAATYAQPQPMRPFNPMAYTDFVYGPPLQMEPYGGVQFMAPPFSPHFVMPVLEPLSSMLVRQIDYYFSDANLVKDEYLKSNMDNRGWVPITLIAGFKRVRSMTNNIQVILESLRTSTVVEIQDDKVRRRNDWMNWIPSSSKKLQTDSSPSSSSLSPGRDTLTTSIQTIALENAAANQNTVTAEPSSSLSDAPVSRSSETVSQQGDAKGTSSS